MQNDPKVDRYRAFMETDFGVNSVGASGIDPQYKVSNAYQMGQINRNLARLVEMQEKAK